MLAFHNDLKIKADYLERVKAHRMADEIRKGKYWENGKGCAVGCTIHGNDHVKYETELGIPRLLARLEDGIFEGLPIDKAILWPEQFLNAITIGADLTNVWPKFASWLLTDEIHGVIKYAKNKCQKEIIQRISDYYDRYAVITMKEWKDIAANAAANANAANAADTAAYAAYSAYAAADAANAAANVANAATAAANAADTAADAANAAYAAAYSAAPYSAADAYAVRDANENARIAQSTKLLELLKECK